MNEVTENFETTIAVLWAGGLHYLESAKWRRRGIQLGALKVLFTGWNEELADDLELLQDIARIHARVAADEEHDAVYATATEV